MTDLEKTIAALLRKAEIANDSGDAMRFTQAALNAANIVPRAPR